MGLRSRLGGGNKKESTDRGPAPAASPEPAKRGRGGRQCMYGHAVPRGKKMCEHRHWVG